MNDEETWLSAQVERTIARELGFGCAVPFGVYAEVKGGKVRVICEILAGRYTRVERTLDKNSALKDAIEIAKELKDGG
jgi:porphobilinogen deaminase